MPGRVSTAQVFTQAQSNITTAREREDLASEKAASGKELVRPSENPGGYLISSRLKDELSAKESMAKNATLANNALAMQETVFTQIQELAQRAHELAISCCGTDGSAQTARNLTLKEVETLYDGAIQILNTRYGDRTLLAGWHSDRAAFDTTGKFLGDSGQIEIEIAPGSKIPINIQAERAVLGVGVDNGVNVLEVLRRLAGGMRESNTDTIRGTLEDLEKANAQMSLVRSEIGARQEQIRHALASHEDGKINMKEEISKIEDADAIKVFSDLSRDQTVLRAAISTSEKILNENPTNMLFK